MEYSAKIFALILLLSGLLIGVAYCVSFQSGLQCNRPHIELKELVTFAIASLSAAFAIGNYCWQVDLQRALLLRELTTKFFTDDSLYDSYNRLIYRFTAADYGRVATAIEVAAKKLRLAGTEIPQPCFEGSATLQIEGEKPLEVGDRRYHPFFFQRSEEEAKLDAVLSYLDMIAYHLEQKHLYDDDVNGAALGEIFETVANKPFITEYMLLIEGAVVMFDEQPDLRTLVGAKVLYSNLERRLAPLRKGKYSREAILTGLVSRGQDHQLFSVPKLEGAN